MVASVKTGHQHIQKAKVKGIAKKKYDIQYMKVVVPGMQND